MSTHLEQIDKVIQQAALDGALTESALKQFHKMVDENESLKTQVADLTKEGETKSDMIVKIQQERDDARKVRDVLAEREGAIEEREKKMTELEIRKECAEQRVSDHVNMFTTVFRNSVLRKQVVTPGHSTVDQYGTRQSDYPDTTPVEEEEV